MSVWHTSFNQCCIVTVVMDTSGNESIVTVDDEELYTRSPDIVCIYPERGHRVTVKKHDYQTLQERSILIFNVIICLK